MRRWPGNTNKMNSKRARSWKRLILPRMNLSWRSVRLRTTGGQGVRREVESEGFEEKYRAVIKGAIPTMNRSAKGEERSSLHYGDEGVLIHSPHQGVCGRHGTEDSCVTPGGLVRFSSGIEISNPISKREMGSDAERVVGQPNST